MATSIWSYSTSRPATGVGTGETYTLNLKSGSYLGNYDYITSINYTCTISSSRYSKTYYWAIENFSYNNSNGSPSVEYQETPMSGNEQTFYGAMNFSFKDRIKFNSSSLQFFIKAYNNGPANNSNYDSMLKEATVTVNYSSINFTAPNSLNIQQDPSTGLYRASWGAATLNPSNQDTITYSLKYYSSEQNIWKEIVSTQALSKENLIPPNFNINTRFIVTAKLKNFELSKDSNGLTINFSPPSLNHPNIVITPNSGIFATATTETNLSITYGVAEQYYYRLYAEKTIDQETSELILCGDGTADFNTKPSIALPGSLLVRLDEEEEIKLYFTFSATTNLPKEQYISSGTPKGTFTYRRNNYFIKYYNGQKWEECDIFYYNGNGWERGILHFIEE